MAVHNQPDFDDLIPELRQWTPRKGFTPEHWIGTMGNYELAIGYSLVFWPRFVVIDDYVLRAGATEENLRHWEDATGKDRRAIEAVINHIHMIDLHDTVGERCCQSNANLSPLGAVQALVGQGFACVRYRSRGIGSRPM